MPCSLAPVASEWVGRVGTCTRTGSRGTAAGAVCHRRAAALLWGYCIASYGCLLSVSMGSAASSAIGSLSRVSVSTGKELLSSCWCRWRGYDATYGLAQACTSSRSKSSLHDTPPRQPRRAERFVKQQNHLRCRLVVNLMAAHAAHEQSTLKRCLRRLHCKSAQAQSAAQACHVCSVCLLFTVVRQRAYL